MTTKLAAIRSNAGIERKFQKQLDAMIDEMQNSLVYWLSAAYRANTPDTVNEDDLRPPKIAKDASSAAILNAIMARLIRRWKKKFNESSKPMADYYAQAAASRTDASLKAALRKAGVTVEFKTTPEIQEIITASVNNNVQSIKSIASEHLSEVAQIVQRCVQEGRNLGGLRAELSERYGITKRKATLIARQSNNQASAMIERQRAKELGITEAQWVHSNAGKHPRHEHVEWHGKMFDINTGMWSKVSKKWVWPGTDFNCRCTSRMHLKTNVVISNSTMDRMR
jgi:SPP1 gp7 family putative phage head morphogenesis protein